MKIKVMLKVKAQTKEEAKEKAIRIMNAAQREDELSPEPLLQSWVFPKEFRK